MFRSVICGLLLGASLTISAAAADVVVRIAPPRPVVERRVVAPGRGYVWVSGFHRWDGREYVWVPGRWELPPRQRAHWVPGRWVHRHGGWVFVEGHWR